MYFVLQAAGLQPALHAVHDEPQGAARPHDYHNHHYHHHLHQTNHHNNNHQDHDWFGDVMFNMLMSTNAPQMTSSSSNAAFMVATATYHLPHLVTLDVSNNHLKHLPYATACCLSCLERLDLASNGFNALPPMVLSCGKLRRLDLSNNCIQILPKGITTLKCRMLPVCTVSLSTLVGCDVVHMLVVVLSLRYACPVL